MDNETIELLEECEYIATQMYDGHFTIMRFATNWRFCFGQPYTYEEIQMMAEGKTLKEALKKGIQKGTDAHLFYKK